MMNSTSMMILMCPLLLYYSIVTSAIIYVTVIAIMIHVTLQCSHSVYLTSIVLLPIPPSQ